MVKRKTPKLKTYFVQYILPKNVLGQRFINATSTKQAKEFALKKNKKIKGFLRVTSRFRGA
jgi:hypothetical protein